MYIYRNRKREGERKRDQWRIGQESNYPTVLVLLLWDVYIWLLWCLIRENKRATDVRKQERRKEQKKWVHGSASRQSPAHVVLTRTPFVTEKIYFAIYIPRERSLFSRQFSKAQFQPVVRERRKKRNKQLETIKKITCTYLHTSQLIKHPVNRCDRSKHGGITTALSSCLSDLLICCFISISIHYFVTDICANGQLHNSFGISWVSNLTKLENA